MPCRSLLMRMSRPYPLSFSLLHLGRLLRSLPMLQGLFRLLHLNCCCLLYLHNCLVRQIATLSLLSLLSIKVTYCRIMCRYCCSRMCRRLLSRCFLQISILRLVCHSSSSNLLYLIIYSNVSLSHPLLLFQNNIMCLPLIRLLPLFLHRRLL